jgi:SAM-dependent methyltransferase
MGGPSLELVSDLVGALDCCLKVFGLCETNPTDLFLIVRCPNHTNVCCGYVVAGEEQGCALQGGVLLVPSCHNAMVTDLQASGRVIVSFRCDICEAHDMSVCRSDLVTIDLWNTPETASRYARLADRCPLFTELAEELADRTLDASARDLVDLGAGTGVSAQALLLRMSEEASLWCVEPATSMLARAKERIHDSRVRWFSGDMKGLVQVRGPSSVDLVSSNLSLWQISALRETIQDVASILRPGGTFGFTVPAEYLGVVGHRVSAEWTAFSQCVEAVRTLAQAFGTTIVPQDEAEASETFWPAGGVVTPRRWEELLQDLGFSAVEMERIDTVVSAEDQAEWLSLQPNRARWLRRVPLERQEEAARLLGVRAKSLPPLHQNWFVVWAKRCEDPTDSIW